MNIIYYSQLYENKQKNKTGCTSFSDRNAQLRSAINNGDLPKGSLSEVKSSDTHTLTEQLGQMRKNKDKVPILQK